MNREWTQMGFTRSELLLYLRLIAIHSRLNFLLPTQLVFYAVISRTAGFARGA